MSEHNIPSNDKWTCEKWIAGRPQPAAPTVSLIHISCSHYHTFMYLQT